MVLERLWKYIRQENRKVVRASPGLARGHFSWIR